MDDEIVARWVCEELWNLHEASWLCAGLDPEGANQDEKTIAKANKIGGSLLKAELTQSLRVINKNAPERGEIIYDQAKYFFSQEVIDWASKKRLPLPEKFSEHLKKQENASLEPRERNSLLQMILGMAIKKYDFTPADLKSRAPSKIAEDINAAGLKVSEKTIRKFLNEALEAFG